MRTSVPGGGRQPDRPSHDAGLRPGTRPGRWRSAPRRGEYYQSRDVVVSLSWPPRSSQSHSTPVSRRRFERQPLRKASASRCGSPAPPRRRRDGVIFVRHWTSSPPSMASSLTTTSTGSSTTLGLSRPSSAMAQREPASRRGGTDRVRAGKSNRTSLSGTRLPPQRGRAHHHGCGGSNVARRSRTGPAGGAPSWRRRARAHERPGAVDRPAAPHRRHDGRRRRDDR